MRGISLDHLRTLTEVVRLGSFSAAAKLLNLSQPAVSLQVRELETRLGIQLVERMGKRAYATAAGEEMVAHAKRIAGEVDLALDSMRRFREGWLGRVRIGTGDTVMTYLLPPVLRDLNKAHPNIELIISAGTTTGMTERLLRNEIDLGVLSLPVDDPHLEVVFLREDSLVAVLPRRMAKAPAALTPADLSRHPLIMTTARANLSRQVIAWLRTAGETPHPAMEVGNVEAIKNVVAAGLGVAVLPKSAMAAPVRRKDLLVRPLKPAITYGVGLVQRRDKPDSPALRFVRDGILALAGR